MTDTIYLLRHGYRLNWVNTNWKSVTGLPRDPPLAAFGVTQSKETADWFLALPEDERPTAIFSSPFYRCLQTAEPIAEALGLPIFVDHGVAEWYSPVSPGTGLHPRPGSAESLRQYFPSISTDWTTTFYPPRRGELVEEIHSRAATALTTMLAIAQQRLSREACRRILIVSHAATVIALARALANDRMLAMRAGCCSLTKFIKDREHWQKVLIADGSHLTGGSTRDWGFEDIEVEHGRVVNDNGEPGTEDEVDEPVGPQVYINAHL